jgi:hypothetical protein
LNKNAEEVKEFEDYLKLLHAKRERWARCYTYLSFNAGKVFN